MKTPSKSLCTAAASVAFAAPALAHEGHGLFGSHWHAGDAWGFIALAVAVAVALYLSRRKP